MQSKSLFLNGDGTISFYGGNGGNGQDGANGANGVNAGEAGSDGSYGGYGADGGNGGLGVWILDDYFIIYEKNNFSIEIKGGAGGAGGEPGLFSSKKGADGANCSAGADGT